MITITRRVYVCMTPAMHRRPICHTTSVPTPLRMKRSTLTIAKHIFSVCLKYVCGHFSSLDPSFKGLCFLPRDSQPSEFASICIRASRHGRKTVKNLSPVFARHMRFVRVLTFCTKCVVRYGSGPLLTQTSDSNRQELVFLKPRAPFDRTRFHLLFLFHQAKYCLHAQTVSETGIV